MPYSATDGRRPSARVAPPGIPCAKVPFIGLDDGQSDDGEQVGGDEGEAVYEYAR